MKGNGITAVKKRFLRIICALLAIMMLCASTLGCSSDGSESGGDGDTSESDLMLGITPGVIAERLPDSAYRLAINKLASAAASKSLSVTANSALSPFAAFFGASLAANALTDKKQNEALAALGGFKTDALNEYNATYAHILRQNEVSVASSFWINSGKSSFAPEKTFLQLNADYYGASGYRLNFSSENTSALINEWVGKSLGISGGTVSSKYTADTASLIADALSFTKSFENGFGGSEDGAFVSPSGEINCTFLISEETKYISLSKGRGFSKALENGCTLVALLPIGTATLEQLLQSLDTDALNKCFEGAIERDGFKVKLPKFSFTCCADISPALKALGIKSAFESDTLAEGAKAELVTEKIFSIASVSLTENGFTTSSSEPETAKSVGSYSEEGEALLTFNKPFAFIIFDDSGIPLTIGTVVNPS